MKTKGLLLIAIFALFSINSIAQESEKRFGVELNGGVSFATSDLNDADLKTGFGLEGLLHYRFMPHTGVYAGWGYNKFSAENSFAGNNADFEETGYVFGLQFKHEFGASPLAYYLRAGALYNHIEIENNEGDIIEDTGHGFGFQLAGGIDIPLGSNWSLTPGVKFNSLSRDLDAGTNTLDIKLNYLSVRIGILKKF
ncbi:MAG: porin family protein [Bacteroidales bacterium]|nr:porin family protein [Bacteroidales bacterium]